MPKMLGNKAIHEPGQLLGFTQDVEGESGVVVVVILYTKHDMPYQVMMVQCYDEFAHLPCRPEMRQFSKIRSEDGKTMDSTQY